MRETSEKMIRMRLMTGGRCGVLKECEKLVQKQVFEEGDAHSSESCRWISRESRSKLIEKNLICEWEVV